MKLDSLTVILAIFFVVAAPPSQAQISLDRQFAAEILQSEKLGQQIYQHDIAAWRATDFLFQQGDKAPLDGLVGWFEEPLGADTIRVHFYGLTDNRFYPIYSIDVVDGKPKRKTFRRHKKSDNYAESIAPLLKARDLGARQEFQPCAENYNTVVFEAEGGGYFVYLLAAATKTDEIHMGGHYKVYIDAAGENILGFEKFTNSCLLMAKPDLPAASTIAGQMVSHILTPYPTEIHVFISYQLDWPLYVVTVDNKAVWRVQDGEIELTE